MGFKLQLLKEKNKNKIGVEKNRTIIKYFDCFFL